MTVKILIVEDDANLRETLADNLELEGYQVYTHATVNTSKEFLTHTEVDLVLLDIMLPDGNGNELCCWIRQHTDVLILMLTARNLEKDVVQGFISGTDDYVSKPYRMAELMLRIKALLRRKPSPESPDLHNINGYQIDWNLREVYFQNEDIHLTKTTFDILKYLVRNINHPCHREDILNAVWGAQVYVDNRTVDNFISNLKKQLNMTDHSAFVLKTIRGVGYSLVNNTDTNKLDR